jgi:DedD protein
VDTRLKQRLVGGIVLVALAVIFVPMVLDGSGVRLPGSEAVDIPPRPKPPKPLPMPIDEPITLNPEPDTPEPEIAVVDRFNRDRVDEEVQASRPPRPDAPAENEPVAEPEPPPEPKLTPPVPDELVSWVVQVGAFSDVDKAEAQRNRLREEKVGPVFVEKYESDRGDFYRVRVGPVLQREEAEALRQRVDESLGVQGRVMQHK